MSFLELLEASKKGDILKVGQLLDQGLDSKKAFDEVTIFFEFLIFE